MIELARDGVQPWDCDRNDHLNMQFYIARASDSLAALGIHIGLGPRELAERRLMLTETEMHVRFLRELRNGVPYVVRGGFVDVAPDALTAFFEMRNAATDEPSATFRSTVVLRDIATFEPQAFDAQTIDRARKFAAEIPAHGMPRGVKLETPRPRPTLAEAEAIGLVPSAQGSVRVQDCDAHGRMQSRAFMAFVFGALGHIFLQTRGASYYVERAARKQGGAALEYRLLFRDRPQAGSVLSMRSGMSAVGEKTFSHIHWLFDVETGQSVAAMEAVSIGLDLETRKSIPISPEMREHYERMIVKDLTV